MLIETPELDRQMAVINSGKAAVVQEFLDWLLDEQGYTLCEPVPESEDGHYMPAAYGGREQLMADHFAIDLRLIDQERRALLDALRADQDA